MSTSQPPSGDAPDLREAAQEVIGAFTIAPGVTTGRQAKALEALRLAALAASQPPSGDALREARDLLASGSGVINVIAFMDRALATPAPLDDFNA